MVLGGGEAAERGQGAARSPRKAARRAAAQARAEKAPLRSAVKAAAREMARLGSEIEALEATLADPAVYRSEKARLAALNKARSDLAGALAAAEARWLAASEALEAAQA